jgi:hypothetical protein
VARRLEAERKTTGHRLRLNSSNINNAPNGARRCWANPIGYHRHAERTGLGSSSGPGPVVVGRVLRLCDYLVIIAGAVAS